MDKDRKAGKFARSFTLTAEEIEFLETKENVSEYIRKIIDKEMKPPEDTELSRISIGFENLMRRLYYINEFLKGELSDEERIKKLEEKQEKEKALNDINLLLKEIRRILVNEQMMG
jgi:hypothetical protein